MPIYQVLNQGPGAGTLSLGGRLAWGSMKKLVVLVNWFKFWERDQRSKLL